MYNTRRRPRSSIETAVLGLEVVYHSIVRSVRSQHNNAFVALGVNVMQAVMFVAVFYIMFLILGMRSARLRGDFVLYIMSGIFLYMTHIRAVGSVSGGGGGSSPMYQHAPMNKVVGIASSALSALYVQILVALIILCGYHLIVTPVIILDPLSVLAMLILAWFTGCSVGMIFMALKPWAPQVVKIASTFYQRANMIASGKMFVANALPGYMLAIFDWNPLFHCIDQARGYMFENYFPRNSSWEYALTVGIILVVLGMLGMFFTERRKSISFSAKD